MKGGVEQGSETQRKPGIRKGGGGEKARWREGVSEEDKELKERERGGREWSLYTQFDALQPITRKATVSMKKRKGVEIYRLASSETVLSLNNYVISKDNTEINKEANKQIKEQVILSVNDKSVNELSKQLRKERTGNTMTERAKE